MRVHSTGLFCLTGLFSLTGFLGGASAWSTPKVAVPVEATPPSVSFPQARDSVWTDLRLRGFIRVGLDPSIGPLYLYSNPQSRQYEGFEWDILQALASELKIKVKAVYIPWGGQLEAIQQNEVDLILGGREGAGLDPTQFLATRAYYQSAQRLVVRQTEANTVQGLSHLFGKKVGIVFNSSGAALLESYNRNRGNAISLFSTSNPDRLFSQLNAGQLDAVLIDQPVAVAALSQKGSALVMVGPPLFPTPLVGVVSLRAQSLKDALDLAIANLQANGVLKNILEEWKLWDSAAIPLASKKD